jgi:hypothetical protein
MGGGLGIGGGVHLFACVLTVGVGSTLLMSEARASSKLDRSDGFALEWEIRVIHTRNWKLFTQEPPL